MSETDPTSLKPLQRKLQNLVACVIAKATHDPAFAHELEEILLSDSLRKQPGVTAHAKAKKLSISPVNVLHVDGLDGLKRALESLTDDELRRLTRSEGLLKGRDLKTASRTDLIAEVIASAERRLSQGESFLK